MSTVIIDGRQCSEAEVAAIAEALSLFADVGFGQLSSIGDSIRQNLLLRKDAQQGDFPDRVARVQAMLRDAHALLHNKGDFKARFDPDVDCVPQSSIRAYYLSCLLCCDEDGMSRAGRWLRRQAEMMAST